MLSKVISEITAGHDIDDQVEILTVLEGVVHVDEEATAWLLLLTANTTYG